MTHRLYTVEIPLTILVFANSEDEARNLAEENADTEIEMTRKESYWIKRTREIPKDWKDDDVPYGSDDGKTLGQLFKLESLDGLDDDQDEDGVCPDPYDAGPRYENDD